MDGCNAFGSTAIVELVSGGGFLACSLLGDVRCALGCYSIIIIGGYPSAAVGGRVRIKLLRFSNKMYVLLSPHTRKNITNQTRFDNGSRRSVTTDREFLESLKFQTVVFLPNTNR